MARWKGNQGCLEHLNTTVHWLVVLTILRNVYDIIIYIYIYLIWRYAMSNNLEKYEFVSWDDHSQYMGKIKHVPKHQPDHVSNCIKIQGV